MDARVSWSLGAGLVGHRHKPERAWRSFAPAGQEVPSQLAEAVQRVLRLVSD